MEQGDLSLACASALVDAFAGGGVAHACLSPGSRSTPLALALARHDEISLQVHLDERSSAFVALGIAKATDRPVIVATTSGTAAAELLPAVVEASQARVPLLLLTADRPPRLRGTGANQTIVQTGLFGAYVRATLDLPVPTAPGQEAWWRQGAREALDAIADGPPGPVHLNCPFEEPLSPETGEIPLEGAGPATIPPDGPDDARISGEESYRLTEAVSGARGAVVVGALPASVEAVVAAWSASLGWPVLAEPLANARRPGEALAAGQSLLTSVGWLDRHRPEVVLQLGATPTTRATQAFVASAERLIVADRWHLDPDPDHRAWWRLAVDPGALVDAMTVRTTPGGLALADPPPGDVAAGSSPRVDPAPEDWTTAWRTADRAARRALDDVLDGWEEPFEPRIARDVAAWIPAGGSLFVGNSTPVRDLDLAMAPRDGLRVLANRGASGIDGLLSTAIGVAAARSGPTVALLGDLSLVHDAGALLWNGRGDIDLTVVVVNNVGGHVFDLLPQHALPEHGRLFVTPHGVAIDRLCAAAGAGHERIDRAGDVVPALDRAVGTGGLRIVEVVVDAELGLRRRAELRDAVDRALAR